MDVTSIYLVVAVIGGVAAGYIATMRGRSFVGFFILGALFPIIGIIVAAVIPSGEPTQVVAVSGWQHPGAVPPAWHMDPAGSGRQRWWDGSNWTEHYS